MGSNVGAAVGSVVDLGGGGDDCSGACVGLDVGSGVAAGVGFDVGCGDSGGDDDDEPDFPEEPVDVLVEDDCPDDPGSPGEPDDPGSPGEPGVDELEMEVDCFDPAPEELCEDIEIRQPPCRVCPFAQSRGKPLQQEKMFRARQLR